MMARRSACEWGTYVAIGDSASEGLWDLDTQGNLWGWTDRLAYQLAQRRPASDASTASATPGDAAPAVSEPGVSVPSDSEPAGSEPAVSEPAVGVPRSAPPSPSDERQPLHYANLAIRGQVMSQILDTQLPRAIQLGADLVSITAGGNDMLRPNVSIARLTARLSSAVRDLRRRGIDVLLVTSSDPAGSPIIEATRPRVSAFNASLWSIAQRYDCAVIDQWGLPALRTWPAWSEDRLHLSPAGHALVAEAALLALGFEVDREAVYRVPRGWEDRVATRPSDRVWLQRHAIPWARRHLRGRSSGDGRTAKRPQPTAVDLVVGPPAVDWEV